MVLNPVRAGMVNDAADGYWSSHLATIGKTALSEWLQVNGLLRQFGSDRSKATLRYIDFVRAGVRLASVPENLQNQIYLGDADFVSNMQRKILSTAIDNPEIPKSQRRPIAKPINHYVENYADAKTGIQEAYKPSITRCSKLPRHSASIILLSVQSSAIGIKCSNARPDLDVHDPDVLGGIWNALRIAEKLL